MHIRFWGARGSLAKAGPTTLHYGDNTSCVEVGMADGTLIVFDMPVVLLTAKSSAEHIAAGFAAGVIDYLTKPFNTAYVRSRVREWLLRKRVETPADA